ncbi:polyprenyl synthetase family protein [Patescibacteria group bacterium]
MKLKEVLYKVKKQTEENLTNFFDQKKIESEKIDKFCTSLASQIENLTLRGGKKTRAFLVWAGYMGYGPASSKPPKSLMSLMMAIELFQSFALIHDDIMDEDEVRRDGITVHKYFEKQCRKINKEALRQAQGEKIKGNFSTEFVPHDIAGLRNKHSFRYGESMAMLAGDMALVWADELVCLSIASAFVKRSKTKSGASQTDVINIYQQMKEEISYGQALDVADTHGVCKSAKEKINELKTARYSVIRPLQLGASLAGASRAQVELIADYGLPTGLSFQAKDDEMDGEITKVELDKKTKVLIKRSQAAVEDLDMKPEIKKLLFEFTKFVIKRKS